jgi:hypothetical protein
MLILLIAVLLGPIGFAAPAFAVEASHLSSQTVYADGKADSLLLSEIPETLEAWTRRCEGKERAKEPDTALCWRDAATALDRYTTGISSSLVEQVQQLQSAWLRRVAQLEEKQMRAFKTELRTTKPKPTAGAQPADDPHLAKKTPLKQSNIKKPARKTKKTPGGAVAAATTEATPAAKPATRKEPDKQSRKQALRVVKRSKVNIAPAKAKPSGYDSSVRASELAAIRAKLKEIKNRLKCSSLACAKDD